MNTVLRRLGVRGSLFGAVFAGAAVLAASVANGQAPSDADPELFAELMDEGEGVYGNNCAGCHAPNGTGGTGPSLVGNDFLASARSTVSQVLAGNPARGMPGFADTLDDREVAALATFVRNSWDNEYGIVEEGTAGRYR